MFILNFSCFEIQIRIGLMIRIAQVQISSISRLLSSGLVNCLRRTVLISFNAIVCDNTNVLEAVVLSSLLSVIGRRLVEILKKVAKVTKKRKFD